MALTEIPIELSSTPGIVDNSNATAITIDASENVGIGVVPAARFDVMATGVNQWYIRNTDGTAQDNSITSLRSGGYSNIALDGETVQLKTSGTIRARIDATGSLNVSRSAYTSASTNGFHANADGWTHTSVSGEPTAYFNRNTSDGEVVRILKDGAIVGSIGSNPSSYLYIGNGDTTLSFSPASDLIFPTGTSGAQRDGFVSLGNGVNRFKDLHMSGTGNIGVGRFTAQSIAHSAATLVLGHEGSSKSQIRAYGINGATIGSLEFMVSAADGTGSKSMTLDSSGNLLVGKTSPGSSFIGSELNPTGYVVTSCVSDFCGYFNRTTTDGGILQFRKDNATVGSIGTGSGLLTIGTGTGNLLFENALVAPCSDSSLGASNGVVDLGASTRRFKDLFLSGGVVLDTGGSPSASTNKLSSYEEGTWTPSVSTSSGTIGTVSGQTGTYTKIGKQVTLWWNFNITDIGTGSGVVLISSASRPFSHDSSISYYLGINRSRSGTSSICELDTSGVIYMYGSTTGVSFYTGTITYNVA